MTDEARRIIALILIGSIVFGLLAAAVLRALGEHDDVDGDDDPWDQWRPM